MSNFFNVVEVVTSNNTSEIAFSVGTPDINDSGTISFYGLDSNNKQGIYKISSNGSLIPIVMDEESEEPFKPFNLNSTISLNNNEVLLYVADRIGPPVAVGNIELILNENGTTTIIDSVFQDRFQSRGYQDLYLNENNFTVAKTFLSAPGLSIEEITLINPNGTKERIAFSFANGGSNFSGLIDLGEFAFNNQNFVAYAATQATFDEFGRPINTENNIFITNGTTITLEDGVRGEDVALNDSGVLVYSTNEFTNTGANNAEILKLEGNNTTSLANTDGLFGSFAEISLNNQGETVFSAFLDDGKEGIFAGFNPFSDRIIAVGDVLSGSTVTDLEFSQEGLNNSGIISFKAELANGTLGIYQVNIRDRSTANIINGTTKADNLVGTEGIDLINGRAGKDKIQGLAGNDIISGGTGNDTIKGNDGNDQITGNSGKDILDGGLGSDTLIGGIGHDSFVLRVGEGTDLVSDYKDRQDKFILSSGLQFSDLTLVQNGNNTQIQLTTTDEVLATVNSVTVNVLNSEDFIVAEI
jgi:Ca2+-binding RTX toxin-like protein